MHSIRRNYGNINLQITAENNVITEIKFIDNHDVTSNNDASSAINPVLAKCDKQLSEYFCGERTTFDLPLKMKGTQFQKQVWNELINIPYSETVSYADIAVRIGNPKAVRAVGGANNKNKIPIIIPCHRVIGKTGKLVGFAGGVDVKRMLLEMERRGITND